MSYFATFGGIMHNEKDINTYINNLTEESKEIALNYIQLLKEENNLSEGKT